jgi:hypothetical protein
MGPPKRQMGAMTAPRIMQWPILKKKGKSDDSMLIIKGLLNKKVSRD